MSKLAGDTDDSEGVESYSNCPISRFNIFLFYFSELGKRISSIFYLYQLIGMNGNEEQLR